MGNQFLKKKLKMKSFLLLIALLGVVIMPAMTKGRFAANKTRNNTPGVGGWGGSCTCPDGSKYWVGDKNNYCKSLACNGGKSGKCNRRSDKKWSRKSVTCGKPLKKVAKKVTKKKSVNKVFKGKPGVGRWGGSCTCPDGSKYWAGDRNNYCKSLACAGGKSGKCNRRSDKKWSHKSVVCGPAASKKVTRKVTKVTKIILRARKIISINKKVAATNRKLIKQIKVLKKSGKKSKEISKLKITKAKLIAKSKKQMKRVTKALKSTVKKMKKVDTRVKTAKKLAKKMAKGSKFAKKAAAKAKKVVTKNKKNAKKIRKVLSVVKKVVRAQKK